MKLDNLCIQLRRSVGELPKPRQGLVGDENLSQCLAKTSLFLSRRPTRVGFVFSRTVRWRFNRPKLSLHLIILCSSQRVLDISGHLPPAGKTWYRSAGLSSNALTVIQLRLRFASRRGSRQMLVRRALGKQTIPMAIGHQYS